MILSALNFKAEPRISGLKLCLLKANQIVENNKTNIADIEIIITPRSVFR